MGEKKIQKVFLNRGLISIIITQSQAPLSKLLSLSSYFVTIKSFIHSSHCCTWIRFPNVTVGFFWSLTLSQICDLPPGTISDITNEHNLTVHWTEKHTHRDCALYTGVTCIQTDTWSAAGLQIFISSNSLTLFFNLMQVVLRVIVGTLLQIRNSSGTVSPH